MGIDPVEATTEYFRLLWEHSKAQTIHHVIQATFDIANEVILFAVPVVWSDRAKYNSYLIDAGAGLADDDFTFETDSEPEAAPVAVLKDQPKLSNISKDDVYAIVDAGDGTVDMANN